MFLQEISHLWSFFISTTTKLLMNWFTLFFILNLVWKDGVDVFMECIVFFSKQELKWSDTENILKLENSVHFRWQKVFASQTEMYKCIHIYIVVNLSV